MFFAGERRERGGGECENFYGGWGHFFPGKFVKTWIALDSISRVFMVEKVI